ADLERFCVWLRAEMSSRRSGSRALPLQGGFECPNGLAYRFSEEATRRCDAKSICDAPLGAMEACFRAAFLNGPELLCEHGLPRECEGLKQCLPYVDWRGSSTGRQ